MGLDINHAGPNILVFLQEIELPDRLTTICNQYFKMEIVRLNKVVEKSITARYHDELVKVYRCRANPLAEFTNLLSSVFNQLSKQ